MLAINRTDTIVALATPAGNGAIAVLRLSGPQALALVSSLFTTAKGKKKDLTLQTSHTLHFGRISEKEEVVDEVLVSVFKGPHSYTGEDTVEISCHGSSYIQQQLVSLFNRHGARLAEPGEFTLRAFLNSKMDLTQAEAVADLIAADSAGAHHVALQQMRGGFSQDLKELRGELIHFASLIELELDFSEEDVEFAHRGELRKLIEKIMVSVSNLLESFMLGNVIKNGVPVVIAGKPNAGKSTLLNVLLNEDRAIVSEIAGTTRDTIEEEITLDGIRFRFIDTAGIRESGDEIESLGIKKTFEKINEAAIVLYLFDPAETGPDELKKILQVLAESTDKNQSTIIPVLNKADLVNDERIKKVYSSFENMQFISAKNKTKISDLKSGMLEVIHLSKINFNQTILVNTRHKEALENTNKALGQVLTGLDSGISGDFIASDIRDALYHLGLISGEVSTDDLLTNIFSRFCIGK